MFHLTKKNLVYVFLSVVIVLVLVAGSVSNTNGFANNYDSHAVEGFSPFQTFLVDIFLKYLLIPALIIIAIWLGISYFVNKSMKSANAALVKSANAGF